MPATGKPVLPLRLIVLDLLGTLVIAAGLYELFTVDSRMFPASMQFPGYALLLIVIGLAIMLPAVFGIVQHFLDNRPGS
ncbi:MAG: tetraspanin family protein [Gammaproteobacteria bacterium]|nr:tetraspanin family protein [Gammaproteobacteria bacterium]